MTKQRQFLDKFIEEFKGDLFENLSPKKKYYISTDCLKEFIDDYSRQYLDDAMAFLVPSCCCWRTLKQLKGDKFCEFTMVGIENEVRKNIESGNYSFGKKRK
jgi:hypothetical protein